MAIDSRLLKRKIAGHEAAARLHLRELATCARRDAGPSFDAAMDLWDLRPELFDLPPDRVREREVAEARAAWRTLRTRLP
jgi:hypothetical protein